MTTKERVTENKYNGWKNYETWVTKLWMDNEHASSEYWIDVAVRTFSAAETDKIFSKSENARGKLSRYLDNYFLEDRPELGASVWADLLNSSLQRVDWYEIANAFLEDNCEEYQAE